MLPHSFLRSFGKRAPSRLRRSFNTTDVSAAVSHFEAVAAEPSSKYQIYLSRTDDPYLNLSIEHYLLQTTPPDSVVILLYSNRPCVVIGRNQNPWLEADLSTLTYPANIEASVSPTVSTFSGPSERIELVRRRSGGGTVFHGPGNVNYSVICPPEQFTRDAHAEMVARALRSMNPTARVNQRHDIVIEAGAHEKLAERDALPSEASPQDISEATATASIDPAPKKVSGSAFKLTRSRALHHGTCLLCSPHLADISRLLSSPAASHLQARGVDSVRSPVANVLPPVTDAVSLGKNVKRFQGAVLRAFAEMYPAASLSLPDIQAILNTSLSSARSRTSLVGAGAAQEPTIRTLHQTTVSAVVGLELATLPSIRRGMTELRSDDWLFGQTPRFTLSTIASANIASESVKGNGFESLNDYGVLVAARGGAITGASYIVPKNGASTEELIQQAEYKSQAPDPERGSISAILKGTQLWKPNDWNHLMLSVKQPADRTSTSLDTTQFRKEVAKWLAQMLPLPRHPHPPGV